MRTFEEIVRDVRQARSISDAQALHQLAVELEALGTPQATALSLHARGSAAWFTGDYALALRHYHRELELQEELGDRAGMAGVTSNIGNVHVKIGDYPLALEHYRRSLAVHEELGDRDAVAGVTGNIGSVYRRTGDHPSALDYYRRALAVHEELNNRVGMADVIGNIGIVYNSTGDYPLALEYLHRSLSLNEELGNRAGAAVVLNNIGNVHYDTGDYTSALEFCDRALALHKELGDRAGIALDTGNMGLIHFERGDYLSALEHYQRALALHTELGSRPNAALVTGNLIHALLRLDRVEEAEALLARQATMRMDNPGVRSEHAAYAATLAELRDDLEEAQRHLLEALAISTEAGLRGRSAEYHEKLRDLAQKRNDFAGYIEHNKEYQRITEEIRGKEATQRMAMMEAERKAEAVERERVKERALLYGALPKSVADRMIRGEKITGDHFEHAAVLFMDVAAFTTHTAAMHPGDVVLLLEDQFSRIDSICDRHGAVKVKTIGDSYMCFRGDADAHTNALCMMHVALDVVSQSFTWPNGDPIQFRIGAHIGPATAGVIGTQRLQYDVWGDTVNVASRMESHGEPGRVHVSEAFASFLGLRPRNDSSSAVDREGRAVIPSVSEEPGTWHLALRGETELKGKGTMTTYWLSRS